MIIYKATNLLNGKSYIGQTIGPLKYRIREHLHDSKKPKFYFHKAINVYGSENFKWEVIDTTDSREKLNQLEVFYIGYYDTFGKNGYNLTTGGDSNYTWNPPEGWSEKMSNVMLDYFKENPKTKPSWSKGLTKETDKRIKRISSNLKGKKRKPFTKKTRRRMTEAKKGGILSEEHKANIRKSCKDINKGIKRPDMTGDNNPAKDKDIRKKISEGVKKAWIKRKKRS